MAGNFVIQDWEEDGLRGSDGKFVQKGDGFETSAEAHAELTELKAKGEVSPKGVVVLIPKTG